MVLAAEPGNAGAWYGLATLLGNSGQLDAALVCARKGAALAPKDPIARSNLGILLFRAERFEEAAGELALAHNLDPDNATIRHNLGLVWYALGDLERAEKHMTAALIDATPDHAPAFAADLSFPILAGGDLARGLAFQENRWCRIRRTQVWDLGIPEWHGEPLAGERIIVHHDQGLGDTIQFSRFLSALRGGGAHVIAAVPRALVRLFEQSTIADEVCDLDQPLPPAQLHSPICSVPRHLGVSIGSIPGAPYLQAWSQGIFLDPRPSLKVGLVWAARQDHGTGPARTVPLEKLLDLALIPGVKLFGLQQGPRQTDISRLGAHALIEDLSVAERDFADTAALMAQLDLVVSVDTSTLHLAGALGLPTIGLLQSPRCWRWLRDREDTPWYPTMRLLTQDRPGNWQPVVDQLASIVAEMATNGG